MDDWLSADGAATRAAGHWKHEQMLDVRERRLKQEHKEAVDVQLE